jgi:hypothetical protein
MKVRLALSFIILGKGILNRSFPEVPPRETSFVFTIFSTVRRLGEMFGGGAHMDGHMGIICVCIIYYCNK